MRKLLSIILCFVVIFSLMGCGASVVDPSLPGYDRGRNSLIELGGGLCYDPSTNIVYWWSYTNHAEAPSPYYAPNGLPYLYNPETNTFEEIER